MKVITCFANHFLHWCENGIGLSMIEIKNGYVEMQAVVEDPSSHDFYSENCFSDKEITGEELTYHMMVLLVDAGLAYDTNKELPELETEYILEDIEICQVLEVLSEEGTNIYSPWGSKCWVYPVGNGTPKTIDMLDALLTLQAA